MSAGVIGQDFAVDVIDEQGPVGRQALLDGRRESERGLKGIDGGIDEEADRGLHGEQDQRGQKEESGRGIVPAGFAPQGDAAEEGGEAGGPERPARNGQCGNEAGDQESGARHG